MQQDESRRCRGNGKWILFSAIVLAMALCTAAYAMQSFRGFLTGPHARGFIKERVLSRVDYTMQELKLTPDQHARYAIIRTKMERGIDGAIERHGELHDTIHAEMDKSKPDMHGLAERVKGSLRTMPDTLSMQIDYLIEVYDILTPDQQAELVERFKDRMGHEDGPPHGFWHERQS